MRRRKVTGRTCGKNMNIYRVLSQTSRRGVERGKWVNSKVTMFPVDNVLL